MSIEEESFIVDTLLPPDEQILAPFSNRFNLSAARLTSEFAAAAAAPKQKEPQLQLELLEDEKLLAQFRANTTTNRNIIVSESTYDDNTLWRIHDVYRTDGATRRCVDTIVEFVIGRRRASVVLDVNDYYKSEEDEQDTLEQIQNNEIFLKYVRGISKINRRLNMHEYQKTILTSSLVYGKAALLVEYDDDPLLNDQAMPIAIKPLNSLRIGRVFYYEDDWSLAGIEYLDFKNKIIEPHQLIYMVNSDHHISPRTLWHGVSIIEPVLDIAETNILNHQTNIKEINRRLWANFLIIKYMGKKKSDITKFKKSYKAGQPIISNRDFEAQVIDVKHDLDKLLQQMDVSDLKIARDLNVPSLVAGFDQNQAMATAGTVMHSWMNSAVESRRTQMRNVFEAQWINVLIARIMRINNDTMESLSSALGKQTEQSNDLKLSTVPQDIEMIVVEDLPFKIKFQFVNIPIATLLDVAATVIGLYKTGIIDLPLALEELDRKQWIPHMSLVDEERKQLQQEMFQQGLAVKKTDVPTAAAAAGQPKASDTERGPDASEKIDAMMANKMNLSNRTSSGSKTAGSNRSLRSI